MSVFTMNSNLKAYGWDNIFEEYFNEYKEKGFSAGRVVESNRLIYTLMSNDGGISGKLSGKYRIECTKNGDYPTVGDWIIYKPRNITQYVSIEGLLPRKSRFSRKVAGKVFEEQVIASNIDKILIVSGLDQDFNLNRLQRYVVLSAESNAEYAFILNKTDVCKNIDEILSEIKLIFPKNKIFLVSALDKTGLNELKEYIHKGETIVFLGSSGVGKSTIINCLLGVEKQKTGSVSSYDGRGRHITTSKNLILLPTGGLVIDTPGLREIQLISTGEGLSRVFGDIEDIGIKCKYKNCKHINPAGCAVLEAVNDGVISGKHLQNYHKLNREIEYNKSRTNEQSKNKKNKFWRTVTKQRKQLQKFNLL